MADHLNCAFCQKNKIDGLPECEVQSIQFKECAVELIEPWKLQVCGNYLDLKHYMYLSKIPSQEPNPRFQENNPSKDPKLRGLTNTPVDEQIGHWNVVKK
jgi:hypothetical protein